MADSDSFSAAQRRVSMQNRTAMRYTDMSNRFMNGGVQPSIRNMRNMPSPQDPHSQAPAASEAPNITPEPSSERENAADSAEPFGSALPKPDCGTSHPDRFSDPISLAKNFLASADTERLLIAALLLLLCSEGADMILIAALLYIFID